MAKKQTTSARKAPAAKTAKRSQGKSTKKTSPKASRKPAKKPAQKLAQKATKTAIKKVASKTSSKAAPRASAKSTPAARAKTPAPSRAAQKKSNQNPSKATRSSSRTGRSRASSAPVDLGTEIIELGNTIMPVAGAMDPATTWEPDAADAPTEPADTITEDDQDDARDFTDERAAELLRGPARTPRLEGNVPLAQAKPVDTARSRDFAILAARMCKDDHCDDVQVLDVTKMSTLADFIVIASGTSDRQMRSVLRHVEELAYSLGNQSCRTTSDERATWLVADFVDIVVHLFEPNTRSHYDLEMLWGDAPRVAWERTDQLDRDRAGLAPARPQPQSQSLR
jgi:ribosome-associated protein